MTKLSLYFKTLPRTCCKRQFSNVAKSLDIPTISKVPQLYPNFVLPFQQSREHPALKKLRTEQIEKHPQGRLSTAPDQTEFLCWLANSLQVQTVVEVGVFLGYTTLALALSLPENGRVIALERDEKHLEIAKQYWEMAGVQSKIQLMIGDAMNSLVELCKSQQNKEIDLVYVDADNQPYELYYEHSLKLLKQNGVIALDNIFMHGDILPNPPGSIHPPTKQSASIHSIQNLTTKINVDKRVDLSLLSIGDGLLLCRKK